MNAKILPFRTSSKIIERELSGIQIYPCGKPEKILIKRPVERQLDDDDPGPKAA